MPSAADENRAIAHPKKSVQKCQVVSLQDPSIRGVCLRTELPSWTQPDLPTDNPADEIASVRTLSKVKSRVCGMPHKASK